MKFLFVHQNFPGQYLYLVQQLAAEGVHDIVFISEPNTNQIQGVRRVLYTLPRGAAEQAHPYAQEFDIAMLRADLVARLARNLKDLGFVPDVIIGHHGWGEMLNLVDVYPDVPLIGYCEFYYDWRGGDIDFDPEFPLPLEMRPRIRARNAVNHLAMTNPGIGQSPTRFQMNTYPDWAQRRITLLPEGVYLDRCVPDAALRRRRFVLNGFEVKPSEKLVTYVARNLEPYRGFHTMMRALVPLMAARPDLKAILVGGDEVSYGAPPEHGTWRDLMLRELEGKLDITRVFFPGKIDYADYLRMLQRTDAHVYLSYPFVASWSLREAMAAACPIVGSDTETVTEFITHKKTGLIADMRKPRQIARAVMNLLEDPALSRQLRHNARAWAEQNLSMEHYLREYRALIDRTVAQGPG